MPFTFIEFFYSPWMEAQSNARAARRLPVGTRGHVLLTRHDPVTATLIRRLEQYQYRYDLVVPEIEEALRLHDLGLNVMLGELSDPETWILARVEEAALVVSTASDVTNTSVAFTIRELAKDLPVVTTATDDASIDILNLAGSSFVLRPEEMIGQAFSRRTVGGDAMSHVIGQFDELMIAEATTHSTPLVGKTLTENQQLFQKLGVGVVGVLERGRFEPSNQGTVIHDRTVLVLAGSKQHLFNYDEFFCIYNVSIAPVVILGVAGLGAPLPGPWLGGKWTTGSSSSILSGSAIRRNTCSAVPPIGRCSSRPVSARPRP